MSEQQMIFSILFRGDTKILTPTTKRPVMGGGCYCSVVLVPLYSPEAERPITKPINTLARLKDAVKPTMIIPKTKETIGAYLVDSPAIFNADTIPRIIGTRPSCNAVNSIL